MLHNNNRKISNIVIGFALSANRCLLITSKEICWKRFLHLLAAAFIVPLSRNEFLEAGVVRFQSAKL